MSKFGVLNEQLEVVEAFATEAEALRHGDRVDELVENLWDIDADWVEDDKDYITSYRHTAAFVAAVERTGLKHGKIAELCGKKPQTIRQYTCGAMKVPKLVALKVKELDKLINS